MLVYYNMILSDEVVVTVVIRVGWCMIYCLIPLHLALLRRNSVC